MHIPLAGAKPCLESVLKNKTDVDFPLHIGPLFGLAQCSHQFLEPCCISRCILKPRQEVKRLPKVMTMVQPACDGWQVAQTYADVVRTLLKDHASFLLGQLPPGHRFLDRNEGSTCRVGTAQVRLASDQRRPLCPMNVALITRHTAEKPDTVCWWGGVRTIEDGQARDRGQSGTCERRDALDPPLSSRATDEALDEGSHSVPFLCLIISRIIANRKVARQDTDTEVREQVWPKSLPRNLAQPCISI